MPPELEPGRLYLGDRRVEKLRLSEMVGGNGTLPDTLVPTLGDSMLVAAVMRSEDGAALPPRVAGRRRGRFRTPRPKVTLE